MEKFQMKKLMLAMIVGLTALTSSQVMAQATSFDEAKEQVASGKRVVEIGVNKENTNVLKGFATGLPLVEVLKQITPNGWVVKKNDTENSRVDINKNVSWTGGSPWNITLGDVVRQANTNAVIDWDKKEVTLMGVPERVTKVVTVTKEEKVTKVESDNKSKNGVSVFELEGTKTIVTGESNYKNMPAVTVETKQVREEPAVEVKQQLAKQEWTLDSSKSLKQNVLAWGAQSGYRVEWIGEDYPIDRSMTIFGEFEGENGPIKQLSNDYGPDSRLLKPLSFIFYQNRVLVVEDMKFEQQGFPQFGQ